MSFASFRGGPCEKNPAIADGVNVLSGDRWRQSTPPAFPLRVLYCFQPTNFRQRHQASRQEMAQQIESWIDIHSLESEPFMLVSFLPLNSG